MKKKVTIKEIAKETGLSIAAVSYVLNGKEGVGPETREIVMEAVSRLGYVPSYTARGLASSHSNLIGVCSPQTEPGSRLMFDNPFYSRLFSSIEYECRINGYHVIISGTDADESFLKLAQQRGLDGMIIIGSYSKEFYSELKKAGIPIVLIDTYQNPEEFHEVKIDDEQGGFMATKYLIDKGHKNIAFISGALIECGVTQLRYNGYKQALEKSGLSLDERFVYPGTVSFESGMNNARNVLELTPEVTAIFCTADIIGVGVVKSLIEMGVKVPEDISVIGFDNLNISEYTTPSLTTVSQDIELKGKAAVDLIIKEINDEISSPQHRVLPLEIIERQSVKKI